MNILQRIKSPTPIFFIKLRNIGLALATISAAILTAPMSLPVVALTVAQYIGIISTIISAVSQITIGNDPTEPIKINSEKEIL